MRRWWRVYVGMMLSGLVVLVTVGGGLAWRGSWRATATRVPARAARPAGQRSQSSLCQGGGTLASTELYNPATGTWAAGPAMTVPRENAAMVTLADGRILVAGGMCYTGQLNVGGVQASAEIYDPVANTWTAVAPMTVPRVSPAAVLLPNGTVLVIGGEDNIGNTLTSAEIYNPATNQWTLTGHMKVARYQPSAIVLTAGPNAGDVLVVGGITAALGAHYFSTEMELYNPSTGRFTPTRSLPGIIGGDNVGDFIIATLPNGNIFLGGGLIAGGETNHDNIYNVQTGTWTVVTRQGAPPRFGAVGVTLADGTVLAIGGMDINPCSSDLYSPASGQWTVTPNPMLDCMLLGESAVRLQNGQVLVAGGWAASALNPQPEVTTDCELYDPVAQTWTATGSLLHARRDAMAALLTTGPNAGDVLIAGGDDGTGVPQPPAR